MKPSRTRIHTLIASLFATLLPACVLAAGYEQQLGTEGNTVLENPLNEDLFGFSITAGDFNGDGIGDLAVATNVEQELSIFYGQPWQVGQSEPADKFQLIQLQLPFLFAGVTLASGDFDDDGRDELVAGYPGWSTVQNAAGGVWVMQLDGSGNWSVQTTIAQGTDGFSDTSEDSDKFGSAFAVGDFDSDGYADIAISAPGEAIGNQFNAGGVMVAYGSEAGISSARDHYFTADNDGVPGVPTTDAGFGRSLASGDFNADGRDDLAIGASNASCLEESGSAGAVIMMLGGAAGIETGGARIFQPGVDGLEGNCVETDGFGRTLATGQFDQGESFDLAIGTRNDAVYVLYSEGSGGLSTTAAQTFRSADFPDISTLPPDFATSLAAGPLRSDEDAPVSGQHSLVIGSKRDHVSGLDGAGSATIIHAEPTGLVAATAVRWTRSSSLEIGPPGTFDSFAFNFAIADWNGDGRQDLAISAPFVDSSAQTDDGAVQVLYQSEFMFRDGFD